MTRYFRFLSDEDIQKLESISAERHFDHGSVIFHEGSVGDNFFIIIEGTVEIWKHYGEKDQYLLAVHGPGQSFGEAALIDDFHRSATVVAREDMKALSISCENFKKIITDSGSLSLSIMKSVTAMIRLSNETFIENIRAQNRHLERAYAELKKESEKRRQAEEDLHKSNQRMYRIHLEDLNRRKGVLIRLAQKLTSSIQLNEDEILRLIYENATELMDTSNMYIALYDDANNKVRFPLAYKDKQSLKVETRKFGHGRTEEIIITKNPILIKTRKESIEWYKPIERQEYIGDPLASWIGVPMRVGDKVIGVVATYHPIEDNLYTKDDLEILQAMANISAIALDNARLVNDLKDAQKGIADRERELVKSGIAMDFIHKVNNVAGTIPAWVSLIRKKLKSVDGLDSKIFEYLDKINRDTGLLLKEADGLRNPISEPEKIDMEQVIGEIVAQVEMLASPDIKIVFNDPDDDLFPVYGIKEQIAVAIYSVIQNGVKAISGQGKIKVDIKNKEERYIEIDISDTGCGISQDKIDSIFEYGKSFWTDKKGTGYGLWRARSIIQSMNGNIKVANTKEGEGSTFTITLPCE